MSFTENNFTWTTSPDLLLHSIVLYSKQADGL